MTDEPTPKEIDDLVYELRQAGKDDTYSLASAVLAKWGAPAFVGVGPVAREQLTSEQIQDLLLCGNPTDEEMRLIRIGWDAAHGIKGCQHGTE